MTNWYLIFSSQKITLDSLSEKLKSFGARVNSDPCALQDDKTGLKVIGPNDLNKKIDEYVYCCLDQEQLLIIVDKLLGDEKESETLLDEVYHLLGGWIDVVNDTGLDSSETTAYFTKHQDNSEFVRLAKAAEQLYILFEEKP
jgi:hypothetical protein